MKNSLIIENYILTKLVRNLEDLEENPGKYTLKLYEESDKVLSYLETNKNPHLEKIYDGVTLNIDGVIRFILNGKEIIGFRYWDNIGVLWAYILNAVESFMISGKGQEYFPEQPIIILLEHIGGEYINFSIDNKKMIMEKEEFLDTILKEAKTYFEFIQRLNLNNYNHLELEQIERIYKLRS